MTTRTRSHNTTLVVIVLAVGFAVVVIALLMAPAAPTTHNSVPLAGLELPLVHLDGNWSGKENDTTFNATVSNNDIKIEMVSSDGTSATYWHGTFKTAESAGNVVISTKTEAADEIILSQSTTKDFTVGQNTLTFKFSALGFSKNLELHR